MVLMTQTPPIWVKSVRRFFLKYSRVGVDISEGIYFKISFVFSWWSQQYHIKFFSNILSQVYIRLILTQIEKREFVVESSGMGLPPSKSVSWLDLSFFCHRHVRHTLWNIYFDRKWQRIPQIWGHVGSE